MTTRDELHRLVDQLPDAEIDRIVGVLREVCVDSGETWSLDDAPEEPATAAEMVAFRDARARRAAGEPTIPHGQVRADIEDEDGMTAEDRAWLDADLSDLSLHEPYDWGANGPPPVKPVKYVPGVGFLITQA